MKFLSIVLPFIVFLFGGAIVWDIYYSGWSPSGDTLMTTICRRQVLVYGLVATAYNAIVLSLSKRKYNEDMLILMLCVPIASYVLTQHILPTSEGADILNSIICLGSMIFAGYIVADE